MMPLAAQGSSGNRVGGAGCWGGVGGARATSFPLGAPVRPVLPQLQEELEQPGHRPGPFSSELVRGWDLVGRGSH